jgi:hypothetical protein
MKGKKQSEFEGCHGTAIVAQGGWLGTQQRVDVAVGGVGSQ